MEGSAVRNGNQKSKKAKLNAAAPVPIKRGYQDAWAGRGFHPGYDGWPRVVQKQYETGRLYVVTLRGEGRPTPPWPETRKLYPKGVVQDQREIREIPGNWLVLPPQAYARFVPPSEPPCQIY